MATESGSPGPLADALEAEALADPGPVPTKRMKIEAAAEELVGGSNTGTEEAAKQRMTPAAAVGDSSSASPAVPINTPPRLRAPPFPYNGKPKDVRSWSRECKRISEIAAKDPRLKLPTQREPQDRGTTDAVLTSREKVVVRGVARSIVNISSTTHDGSKRSQCTGIIMGQRESSGKQHTLIVTCSKIVSSGGTLVDPVPKAGNGGPVIDHDGNVTGMAFYCRPNPTVLSISTIVTCIEMWLKFSRIARPIHGLGVRTFELLDVSLQEEISLDHGINTGFIVDTVSDFSAAESLGILPGDVIVSFDDRHALTLPQLEDYLLSLGWTFLNNSSSTVDLKLEVYDLMKRSKRSITLPMRFCDA